MSYAEESYLRHKLIEPPYFQQTNRYEAQAAEYEYYLSLATDDTATACSTPPGEGMRWTEDPLPDDDLELPGYEGRFREPPPGASAEEAQRSTNDYGTGLTPADWDAACTLVNIRRESQRVAYGYIQRANGNMLEAGKALMRDTNNMTLFSKPAEPAKLAKAPEKRVFIKGEQEFRDKIDAALTMIKLSGQSRTESRAAIALVRLQAEAKIALHKKDCKGCQRKDMIAHAKRAIDKMEPADQMRALAQFRKQYPDELRASKGAGGGDVRNVMDVGKKKIAEGEKEV